MFLEELLYYKEKLLLIVNNKQTLKWLFLIKLQFNINALKIQYRRKLYSAIVRQKLKNPDRPEDPKPTDCVGESERSETVTLDERMKLDGPWKFTSFLGPIKDFHLGMDIPTLWKTKILMVMTGSLFCMWQCNGVTVSHLHCFILQIWRGMFDRTKWNWIGRCFGSSVRLSRISPSIYVAIIC